MGYISALTYYYLLGLLIINSGRHLLYVTMTFIISLFTFFLVYVVRTAPRLDN